MHNNQFPNLWGINIILNLELQVSEQHECKTISIFSETQSSLPFHPTRGEHNNRNQVSSSIKKSDMIPKQNREARLSPENMIKLAFDWPEEYLPNMFAKVHWPMKLPEMDPILGN